MQLGITVVPVVGILSDKSAFDPVLNAGEVEAIFDAPLEMFLKVLLSILSTLSFIEKRLLLDTHFGRVIFSLL